MAIIKCKKCGTLIEYDESQPTIVCIRCGTTHQNKQEKKQKLAKHKSKIKIAIVSALSVIIASAVVFCTVIIPSRYNKAINLASTESYVKAYTIFAGLGNYKDSRIRANELKSKYPQECFVEGDTITFGQTDDKEDIEWIVLNKKKDKALIIQKYLIGYSKYGEDRFDHEWEDSKIRSDLNSNFLTGCFSPEEQSKILSTTVSSKDQYGRTYETTDKIFILSASEVKKYFNTEKKRQCQYISEVYEFSWISTDANGISSWWLRYGGKGYDILDSYVSVVQADGKIDKDGDDVETNNCVRPAMWISLSK